MTKIYLISDTHFFHGNIIKYCNRPFKDYNEMNDYIVEEWNKTVSKEDIVIHLGDFAFRNKANQIRSRLNGTIILIRGNHDLNINRNDGFIIVEDKLIIGNLILTHRPLEKIEIPVGFTNIHGHIHNKISYNGVNVSAEVLDYKPILINSFINSNNI